MLSPPFTPHRRNPASRKIILDRTKPKPICKLCSFQTTISLEGTAGRRSSYTPDVNLFYYLLH